MRSHQTIAVVSFSFLLPVSFFIAICHGSQPFSLSHLRHAIFSDSLSHQILFSLRLPHVISAFTTGGLLALAGALMQVLLRNPLADPYILGTSSGAALGAMLFCLCGLSSEWFFLGTWLGSFISILLIFLLTRRASDWHADHLILLGIGLATSFSALISLLLLVFPDHMMRGMFFWLIGDLSETTLPYTGIIILLISTCYSFRLARQLNILSQGENHATALGVPVFRLKIQLFLISALLTGTAVSIAGCVGFIGLIIPHLLRLLIGYDHHLLLPCSVVGGGIFLMLTDTIARSILSPQTLPVGIVMALLGTPLFIYLLQKKQ